MGGIGGLALPVFDGSRRDCDSHGSLHARVNPGKIGSRAGAAGVHITLQQTAIESACFTESCGNPAVRGNEYFELKAFSTIIDCGSFARAAEILEITPSALSQTIRRLESRLGVRLLNRTTRSVSATDAGRRLLARLKPALQEIHAALEDVISLHAEPAGTLRLHIPRLAARTFLEPILEPFASAYPKVILDVTVDDEVTNIIDGGFDLGIRQGELLEDEMVASPIGPPIRYVPVATPAYLAQYGVPVTPQDLREHRCINWRQHGTHAVQDWEFEKDGRSVGVSVKGPLVVSERNLALSASLRGVGIAFVSEELAMPFIREGKLERLLDAWCPHRTGWYLFYYRQPQIPATVKAFVNFAHSVFKKT